VTFLPSAEMLNRATEAYGAGEQRDLFYRAASDLVELSLQGLASVTVGEALAVLLQTWNRPYYQFRPARSEHFAMVDQLWERHQRWLTGMRGRPITSLGTDDEPIIQSVFGDFERVLGPVGAAKALHLLAPRFFALWDRAIALAYGLSLGPVGTNGNRYLKLLRISQAQVAHVEAKSELGRNALKAIDEYNYCRFTKGWLSA
jgi:hypothetical protein